MLKTLLRWLLLSRRKTAAPSETQRLAARIAENAERMRAHAETMRRRSRGEPEC